MDATKFSVIFQTDAII